MMIAVGKRLEILELFTLRGLRAFLQNNLNFLTI